MLLISILEQTLAHLRSKGHKRLAIIATTSAYTDALIAGLKKHLQPDEHISLLEYYELSQSDFRGIVAKLKAGSFDAIGVYLFPGQLSLFIRQAKDQQLSSPIFGPDTFESANEIQNSLGGLEGAIFASNPIDRAFAARYRSRFKNDAQLTTAANAYDIALLIGDTLRRNPKLSSEELLNTLSQTVAREGVSGKFSFRDSETFGRFFDFTVVTKTIDGGQIRTVD
jgi:ABC-type branched-subunit amino acid transport system substrate-binding protein